MRGNQIYAIKNKCTFYSLDFSFNSSLFLCPGREQSEAARISASLQALRLTINTFARGSEGHVHTSKLPLRLLHPLPAGLPRLDPLQGGAAPNPRPHPDHTRQRSQQEEHQAPVMWRSFTVILSTDSFKWRVIFLWTGSCWLPPKIRQRGNVFTRAGAWAGFCMCTVEIQLCYTQNSGSARLNQLTEALVTTLLGQSTRKCHLEKTVVVCERQTRVQQKREIQTDTL